MTSGIHSPSNAHLARIAEPAAEKADLLLENERLRRQIEQLLGELAEFRARTRHHNRVEAV